MSVVGFGVRSVETLGPTTTSLVSFIDYSVPEMVRQIYVGFVIC